MSIYGVGVMMVASASGRPPRAPTVIVRTLNRRAPQGRVQVAGWSFRCAIGRTGCRILKREGDGATPIGLFAVRAVLWRPDRSRPPRTAVPLRPLRPDDGWCDAVGDRNYNRAVRYPYPASAEALWRDDPLYDLIVVLGANDRPRFQGRGSAIFMHVARPDYTPTAGCIALSRRDLCLVLGRLRRGARLAVPG